MNFAVADLLAHRPPMILLDRILACDETTLEAGLTITPSSMFCGVQGVPVHIGLEYMAQACGAHVGALARMASAPVRIGFLLGTRRYEALVPHFALGDELLIHVETEYSGDKMASYRCRITIGASLAATAQLNFYQPDEAELSAGDGAAGP
jgi:3-oxoacyl-[acyl-carrier-protein] synthase I